MARYPIGSDGRLIEIVIDGPLPSGTIGEADGPPADGRQVWSGAAWEWPVAHAKAMVQAKITAAYDQRLDAGLAFGGKVLQLREKDQANLTAMGSEARWAQATNATWPPTFAWRMADDTFLPLPTAAAMIALAEAGKNEVLRLRMVKWGHDDNLALLTDPHELLAYDYSGGW